jgi:4-amino-4-deoxy-L-arabinose transferase-like glycosyltransferase
MTISGTRWSARRLARGGPAAVLLIVAVVVGYGARVAVESSSPVFASDTFQSLLIARSLIEGRGFASGGAEHPDLSRSVLFPMSIAAVTAIVGNVEWAARAVVLLAGALLVVPLFFLARSAFGPSAALAALPLGALSCIVGASSRLLSTSLFVSLVMAGVALTWIASRRQSRFHWVAAGASMGLAALARPEGIGFPLVVAVWAMVHAGRGGSHGRRVAAGRLQSAALVVGAFIAVYAPYVLWASWRLARFAPSPGIEYVQSERGVSDHLGLREISSHVPWTSRARFMLTSDHTALYLDTYFRTGTFPAPDLDTVGRPLASDRPVAEVASPWRYVALRRWNIARGNLLRAPLKAAWAHFLPPVVVTLALVGLVAALWSPRGRQAMLLLALTSMASMTPLVSHIEDRFFYLPFAIVTMLASVGWGAALSVLAFVPIRGVALRIVQLALSSVLVALVAVAGMNHEGNRADAIARAELLKREASNLTATLPHGAVLSIDPHFPFWAGRAYRPIPFATPQGIVDYARAQGATALVLEGTRDLAERPDLDWLQADPAPPPFRLVFSTPHPSGGAFLVFAIDRPGSVGP